MLKLIPTYLLSFLLAVSASGNIKNVGVPNIHNYSKNTYKASTQNWKVQKNSKNFIYFANNNSLLEFDGLHWQLYGLPNQSIIRSLRIDDNDRIYTGQYNEFGYMEPDFSGRLVYHSLSDLVSEKNKKFQDIWCIHITDYGVVFQSYTHLFIFRDGELATSKFEDKVKFSFYVNERLLMQKENGSLIEYRQGGYDVISTSEELSRMEVWTILPISKNKFLIGTLNNGVFVLEDEKLSPWVGDANNFLATNKIYSATKFNERYYAFGTIQNGLLITDEHGKIIQHINKNKGLQNNTILSIGVDKDQNLWLGLDNGIDYIDISSPFTYIWDDEGLGATYTSLVSNGKLYVGTNRGLFVKEWPEQSGIKSSDFMLIPETSGQVWYLGEHKGQLMCGHDKGTFIIDGDKALLISEIDGAWTFLDLKSTDNYLIGGNYNGLCIYKKSGKNSRWSFHKKIKGFDESSRILEQDKDGAIWMSHGYKGIFKIELNNELDSVKRFRLYDSKDGLPSNFSNNLIKIGSDLTYTTADGIYSYNETTDSFIPSAYLNRFFDNLNNVEYLKQDASKNIWFIAGGTPGVLRFQEDGTYTKVDAPFKALSGRLISGFQHINPVNSKNTFIAMEDGLAHYSPVYRSKSLNGQVPKTYIRSVENISTHKLFYPSSINWEIPIDSVSYRYKGNNLRITYACPDYQKDFKYSYFLENYSLEWTDWTEKSFCEFMNLHEGEYVFKVKSIDSSNQESEIDSFSFVILPPWYRSVVAYIFYSLCTIALLVFTVWFVLKRIRISKRKERYQNLLEHRKNLRKLRRDALVAEKEIVKLRNAQLREKMVDLDKELANQTMKLVRKNRFFNRLKTELKSLQNQAVDSTVKSKISLIINRIDKEYDEKRQKELFEKYFDEVHEDFFKRLNEKFPSLTPREQRLCAYIKMNISSKEIATLQNISIRGVEVSRYRLRKKLGLDRDTNLGAFILNI